MRELISEVLTSVYLASPGAALWRWSADGRALEWSEGTTALFRPELTEILARLAPQGLPSLTSIVLLCGACRESWRESSHGVLTQVLREIEDSRAEEPRGRHLEVVLAQVLGGLDRLARLPAELRRSVDGKATLCAALVDQLPLQFDPHEAARVVDTLAEVRPAQSELGAAVAPLAALLPDLRALRDALDGLELTTLEARMRTGVAEALRPAPVELPPSERVRRLLEELRGDGDLAGLARLASELLAAVHVPRPQLDRDEQPLGGVADISNRGPLDRLLLSELAHDELTFMVRVSMGEALYLRRESPPRRPPVERRVLLDCGIRLWGTPRVFAAGVGLALAADTAAGTRVRVHRARRGEAVACDLLSREGVLDLLTQLEPDPEPGQALGALVTDAAAAAQPVDVVLVTHADALATPALRQRLRALPPGSQVYVATVDAEGAYALWRYGDRGRKRLAQARLDLRRLLRRHDDAALPGQALSVQPVERSLPRVLSLDPLPLRLPCPLRVERSAHHPRHGVLTTSSDRRLLHWTDPQQGALELTAGLPTGLTRWIEIDDEGLGRCLRDGPRAPVLVLADLRTGKVARLELAAAAHPHTAFRVQGALALVYEQRVQLVSLATGERCAPLALAPGTSHVHGRVFRRADGTLAALDWDGDRVRLQPLPSPGIQARVLLAWERGGQDGFCCLVDNGAVFQGEEPAFFTVHEHESLLAHARLSVSRDGQRLLAVDTRARGDRSAAAGDPRRLLIDLQAREARPALGQPLALEPALVPFSRGPTLRKRIQAVGVDPAGRLALVTRRQRVFSVALDPAGDALHLVPNDGETPALYSHLRGLTPIEPPAGRGYTLRRATWRDGSRAYLDSRGLLHLQSSRREAPELTLALVERGPLAAWSSGLGGGLCGEPYFLGEAPSLPPPQIHRQLRRFVERLR
jgi:hypothetical protein